MLNKSKSKQIHLAKYLLIFPMVIGMLFYTSCSNDEKINQSEELSSNLAEDELLEKYLNQFKNLGNEENAFSPKNEKAGIFDSAIFSDNYISTLNEYTRSKAILIRIYERANSISENEVNKDKFNKIKSEYYADYLERKKTQESIGNWENSPRDGQLRKHVKDLDNITAEEQKLIDSQVEQIRKDDYYTEQIISDGLRHKKIEFRIKEIEEVVNTSFSVIDQVPVFPGSDTSASNDVQRKYFSDKINKLVTQNFNLDLGKTLGLTGKQRIYARFTINKEGNIVDIKTRAPHPELEKEAKRVVKLIPQVQPGKQDGELVNVTFDLPITFNIKE